LYNFFLDIFLLKLTVPINNLPEKNIFYTLDIHSFIHSFIYSRYSSKIMQRHVSTLPLPSSYITKLTKHGIESLNDLKNLKPTDLIKG